MGWSLQQYPGPEKRQSPCSRRQETCPTVTIRNCVVADHVLTYDTLISVDAAEEQSGE